MALTLYRRHLASCVVKKSRMSARSKRQAMGCQCPVWMYGQTGNSLVPRQSTGFTDLADGEAMRDALTAECRNETVHGPKIRDCGQKDLESRKQGLGEKT